MCVTGERDDLSGGTQKVGVAVADLIPGLHKRAQLRDTLEQVGLIVLGVATVGLMAMWLAE